MHQDIIAGFNQPIADTQLTFRKTLTALSEPGTLQTLPYTQQLYGLQAATWALLQSVLDADVSVYLAPALNQEAVRHNLQFHTACHITEHKDQADYIVSDLETAVQWDWRRFKRGTERSPELSCTLIIQTPAIVGDTVSLWQGPGINQTRQMYTGLNETFWLQRAAAMAFPLGVDVVMCHHNQLLGLPRSTQVVFSNDELNKAGVASCM